MARQPLVGQGLMNVEVSLRHATLGRTPLDEWSASRSEFYPKTYNNHNRQTSLPPAGFEPVIPSSKRPQTVRPLGSTSSHLMLWKLMLGEQYQCGIRKKAALILCSYRAYCLINVYCVPTYAQITAVNLYFRSNFNINLHNLFVAYVGIQ
jgi:hypothetical protein